MHSDSILLIDKYT